MQSYALIVVISAIIIVAIIMVVMKRKEEKSMVVDDADNNQSITRTHDPSESEELGIKFEEIPSLSEEELNALVEVDMKDQRLLGRIDNLIPGFGQAIANSAAIVNFNNTMQNMGPLYQAVIPKGVSLAKSKATEGAFRGFYHDHGIHHGEFLPYDASSATPLVQAGAVNAAMGILSVVVGQYYMKQIDGDLSRINDQVNEIHLFQDTEFKGKVIALITQTKKLAIFQSEILENDDLKRKMSERLNRQEEACTELLGQTINMIQRMISKSPDNFDDYVEQSYKLDGWIKYMYILREVLWKNNELNYVFNHETVSKDMCFYSASTYEKEIQKVVNILDDWHETTAILARVDLKINVRMRTGISAIPGLFFPKLGFEKIPKNTMEMIARQRKENYVLYTVEQKDLYNNDMRLIIKDGKTYYLPL